MAGKGKGEAGEGKADKAAEKPQTAARWGLSPGMIILGTALLFIATMGSAFLAVTFLGKANGNAPATVAEMAAQEKKAAQQMGPTQEIGNFTVNLADVNERFFVKAGVAVEASDEEAAAELTTRGPQLKDIVIGVLSSRTMADISNPDGKEAVKKEIRDKINRLLPKGKVRNVFFTEFVFQ